MARLPKYTLGDVSGAPVEQLGKFEIILDEASINGLVDNSPENASETYNMEMQRVRLQTIATRLYLLGYLRRKISPRRIHKKLDDIRSAVLQFQKDAGLVEDYWVGDKTWYALDELVSFESQFTYENWFANGEIRKSCQIAIQRAIQLRLWSLGLYHQKPKPIFKGLSKKSLYKFGRILKIFLIKDDSYVCAFNQDTLSILFDQDALTTAITKCSKPNKSSFFIKLAKDKKNEEEKMAQAYMVNCAKIELWLLGYDVKIDGRNNYQYEEGGDIWNAIASYHRDFEGSNRLEAEQLAMQITPQLFLGIGAALEGSQNKDAKYSEDEASEIIARQMMISEPKKANTKLEEAWQYIKQKGVRLWDGLKRIWRWIKKIGRKVLNFIKTNIFKGFYRFISKAYKIVTKGISEVVKSISSYIKGGLASNHVFFKFSKDMDIQSYISNQISTENGIAAIKKLNKQSLAFNIGCRIIGMLFYVFKNALKGFFGWAKILFALLKSYKDLRVLYLDLKVVAQVD